MPGKHIHDAPDAHVLCPSYRCEAGAIVLGMVQPDGGIAFAPERLEVTQEFVDHAWKTGEPYDQFRFSGRCAQGACKQWTGSRCSVIDREAVNHPHVPVAPIDASLPECAIRPQCRWYLQTGADACAVCVEVISKRNNADERHVEDGAEMIGLGMDRLRSLAPRSRELSRKERCEALSGRYFQAFSQRDWDSALSLYAPEFFRHVSMERLREMLGKFADSLGGYRSRDCQSEDYQDFGGTVPARQLTLLTYRVHYDHGETNETLTLLETDLVGGVRIICHRITSAALLSVTPGISTVKKERAAL